MPNFDRFLPPDEKVNREALIAFMAHHYPDTPPVILKKEVTPDDQKGNRGNLEHRP